MRWLKVVLRCVGEAVCARGLRGLAAVVPFGEALYDVAGNALDRLRHEQYRAEDRATLAQAARATMQQLKDEVQAADHEGGADEREPLPNHLAGDWAQIPPLVRRTGLRTDPRPMPPPAAGSAPAPIPDPERCQQVLRAALEAGPHTWLLDLTNKQIGDAGALALAAMPALGSRSMLYLQGNQIGDAGAAALAASPHVGNVTHLVLWDNRIGDAGVTVLANAPGLANLSVLNLGHNRVGDAGAIALANSPHLANLGALILVSNQIGDAGALALAKSPYLEYLAELKPLDNRITPAGVTALRERFGKRVRIY